MLPSLSRKTAGRLVATTVLLQSIRSSAVLASDISFITAFQAAASCNARSSHPHSRSSSSSSRQRLGGSDSSNIDQQKQQSSSSTNNRLFWNREMSSAKRNDDDDGRTDADVVVVKKPAKIISLSDASDPANAALHSGKLPPGAELIAIGSTMADFDVETLQQRGVNTIFVSHPQAREPLAELLNQLGATHIEWVHTRSAGVDFVYSSALTNWQHGVMTNAKGQFSSTLAEYTMGAIAYFAKDFGRLKRSQQSKQWDSYSVLEMRGATLGIVGFGDIGRAVAKLAKAYGMHIIALRRHPEPDEYVDEMLSGADSLNAVFARSDYVLCALPLTPDTNKMIGKEQFDAAATNKKGNVVFINIGRGPVVDEEELIAALQDGRLKGAALDVFAVEPLPETSKLWELDNVLLSPHNMDRTDTFMHESTEFFVNEQLPRFIQGLPLYNEVDRVAGY